MGILGLFKKHSSGREKVCPVCGASSISLDHESGVAVCKKCGVYLPAGFFGGYSVFVGFAGRPAAGKTTFYMAFEFLRRIGLAYYSKVIRMFGFRSTLVKGYIKTLFSEGSGIWSQFSVCEVPGATQKSEFLGTTFHYKYIRSPWVNHKISGVLSIRDTVGEKWLPENLGDEDVWKEMLNFTRGIDMIVSFGLDSSIREALREKAGNKPLIHIYPKFDVEIFNFPEGDVRKIVRIFRQIEDLKTQFEGDEYLDEEGLVFTKDVVGSYEWLLDESTERTYLELIYDLSEAVRHSGDEPTDENLVYIPVSALGVSPIYGTMPAFLPVGIDEVIFMIFVMRFRKSVWENVVRDKQMGI